MAHLEKILSELKRIKPELEKKYHIRSLGLFGSIVRDDFSSSSDIDIIVDFAHPVGIEFIDLADYVEKQLQRKIDLVSRNGVKDKYYKLIEPEIIYV